ncbi:substrate-binding domain-containing protein [Saccharomonospora sp. NPDC046836]|uniref:substrate-binding domain-containing protein n=1 Tax=Saccharomonospora sp. NPDC046836 TaxID=3156921 RepID=UPI0033F824B5
MRKKRLCLGAVAGLLAVGLATGSASADPSGTPTYRDLAGVGSDTTQDVMNGLADTITVNGSKVIGSYDATGSATITTKDPATSPQCQNIPRPVGSGNGVNALVNSLDNSTGCVQFARSSSNNASSYAGKNLTYIPFAVDAVTYAVRSDSSISKRLTTAQLRSIYNCTAPGSGTTYKPLLPQYGSGTRQFFMRSLGLTDAANYTQQFTCVSDVDATGQPIIENTGTFLAQQQHIAPYSIAQYISQIYGVSPSVQGKAVLTTMNGVAATVLNTGSSFKRDVYNVVPTGQLGNAPYSTVFVGPNSAVCTNAATITRYGFGTAPNCGDTSIVTP